MSALLLRQNEPTAAQRRWLFACIQDADGKTPVTGIGSAFATGELQLSKDGGTLGNATGTPGEVGSGLYFYEAAQAEADTAGPVGFKVERAAVRTATSQPASVVGFDPYATGAVAWPVVYAQSEPTASKRRWYFACVDDTDGKTGKTGLTFSGAELQVTKNGAAFVNFGGTSTELSDGLYEYEASAGELDTLGVVGFKVNKATVRLVLMQVGQVVPAQAGAPTSEAAAYETILQRWVAQWPLLQPTIPWTFGNEAFPTTGVTTFACLTFGALASKQISQGPVGRRIFERKGSVIVKLFGAVDAGDSPLATLMGSVRTTLEAQEIGGGSGVQPVQTYAASDTAPAKQGSWYTKAAVVPFVFYERA